MSDIRHIVIGCGGIGRWVVAGLAPTLDTTDTLLLIDGDEYEPRNLARQGATHGLKVDAIARAASQYRCAVQVMPVYLTEANIYGVLMDGDVVWACLDNHPTRRLVIDACAELENITLISAGNDDDEGNVFLYRREGGEDRTPHPFVRHPELKTKDKFRPPAPAVRAASCAALADDGSGQTIRTNMLAAVAAMSAWARAATTPPCEIYFQAVPMGVREIGGG